MRSINKQQREKSIKTKVDLLNLVCICKNVPELWTCSYFFLLSFFFSFLQVGAFSVLKELVVVLPDCLADHIGSLIPGIEKALFVSFYFDM